MTINTLFVYLSECLRVFLQIFFLRLQKIQVSGLTKIQWKKGHIRISLLSLVRRLSLSQKLDCSL